MVIKKNVTKLFILSLLVGFILRIIATYISPQIVDVDSFYLVGNLVSQDKNIYFETTRYNYGPIWSLVCGAFFILTKSLNGDINTFRYINTIFLSLVDICIAIILFKKFTKLSGFLYILSPVSIILSGTHGQFDAFSVLICLISTLYIENENIKSKPNFLFGSFLLGLSLAIKHIYFLLPFWWVLKVKTLKNRIIVFIVPITIFFISFLPFLPEGANGIYNNVFSYRGELNTFFYQLFVPFFIQKYINPFALYFGLLVLGGLLTKKINFSIALVLYSLILVTFSPALHNQYFNIVLVGISIYPNAFFITFSIIHLILHLMGNLHIVYHLPFSNIPITGASLTYFPFVTYLFSGLVYFIFSQKIIFKNNFNRINLYLLSSFITISLILTTFFYQKVSLMPLSQAIKSNDMEKASNIFNSIHKNPPLPQTLYYLELKPYWDIVEKYQRGN